MAAMMEANRTSSRRERTFVGSECAVCEEPLEHMLRGERILQFSCGHVSHEACLYEILKESETQYCPACDAPLRLDTSRCGGLLDIEKIGNLIRSSTFSDAATLRSDRTAPSWDHNAGATEPARNPEAALRSNDVQDAYSQVGSREMASPREPQHLRSPSGVTGAASSTEYTDSQHNRRHDYDVQAMESDLSPRPASAFTHAIPAPTVTIRSEFPTLNRSRQQQPLTCLITVEVPEGSWQPGSEDLPQIPETSSHVQIPREDPYMDKRHLSLLDARSIPYEPQENLDEIAEDLRTRVDNWHGLEFDRFGKLRLHGELRVGKDGDSWQELQSYLFDEMLICVKERKHAAQQQQHHHHHYDERLPGRKRGRCTLKGSILIKKHLSAIEVSPDEPVLTLNLAVRELPSFFLRFQSRSELETWKGALLEIHPIGRLSRSTDYDVDNSGTEDDDYRMPRNTRQSYNSSEGAGKSTVTAITEYTNPPSLSVSTAHIPIDIVVVIPVSSSMQGLKITLLRDALNFLVRNLGPRDRMGLVTFGSSAGGVPVVGMTTNSWGGWSKVIKSIRPVGQKTPRSDVVDGANVAMDLLMQRRSANPISNILLISDSSTSDPDSVDFVVSRAEAAKVSIQSLGLGLTHKPDTMIEISTRTKGSYVYVKDWMMLRESVAGCLGSLQSTSHQNAKLKLRLPEGSPAKFVKITGALHTTRRATGRDAEVALGDLRFGDKRDVLVQLVIQPDAPSQENMPQDPWEKLVSGLEALGGGVDGEEQRVLSVEEVPLIQADLTYGDLLRDGHLTHSPRPSLFAITMLPHNPKARTPGQPITPPIPPHPSIVQRRMELLTSDMMSRALTLVSRGQHDRAQHLLTETRSILKGLGKGSLPPLPPGAAGKPMGASDSGSRGDSPSSSPKSSTFPDSHASSGSNTPTIAPAAAVDSHVMAALDADLEGALEWIYHPAVFARDSRKAVLQAIGVTSSQRAYTFRTASEAYWARRITGIRRLAEQSKEWRQTGHDLLVEE